ncbi:MAG: uroporphyrinogen-III C-methyltransferase [Fusobacteriaceae bacterium]|nr:uroporphyrinogen-III C-methyltransferase [Fusobacteriaceae bacterium]MBP9510672.1 uroporphyrinogen-III C-methyltransferase [Fusobacteriaceae bacterium]
MKKGKVYFVGAGPGTLDLLTIKGKQCVEMAECIIYDRLIDPKILQFAKKDVELIYVGKESTTGGETQLEINETIVKKYLEGKIVVRLKGGDPFVFGRGGEEIIHLKKYGGEFELVPGVTSAISVPEYSGIPVTHRGVANSFHVFTGHLSDDNVELDYKTIAKLEGTLIFLMGVQNLNNITSSLIKNGKKADTPVAIIQSGTTAKQRVITGVLEDIYVKSVENNIKSPSITVVGDVVNLRESLKWLENRELYGKKILITRDSVNSNEFSEDLLKLGAEIHELPFIEINKNQMELDNLERYSAILFNSPNGVKFFMEEIKDIRVLLGKKIGVVGEKTKEELLKYKIYPDFMPQKYTIDELVKYSLDYTELGSEILVVTSNISPCNISSWEKMYNRNFSKIIAYNTDLKINDIETVKNYLEKVEYITFLSSSAVEAFYKSINGDIKVLQGKKIVSIGEVTTKTIRDKGMELYLESKEFTAKGVIEVIKGDINV